MSAAVYLAAESRSFERAEKTLEELLGLKVSRSTIRRLAKEVGLELATLEPEDEEQSVVIPDIAVVSCDGGRIRTREPDNGRGVKLSGENGWREDKVASFERMTANKDQIDGVDPCPNLPTTFRTAQKVAKITEKPALELNSPSQPVSETKYKGPQRILRTVQASIANAEAFGLKMKHEAARRRLPEANKKAFIADGLNWNWSVWKTHFPDFTPILDFIHAIEYVYSAARALYTKDEAVWETYTRLVEHCWTGHVDTVIDELRAICQKRQIDIESCVNDEDPYKPVADAVRYLTNNQSKMDYPAYRSFGLPITSAPMESLVKQMNQRVKGTEMFWDDPQGAEAILHLRAALLSDDDRLRKYLKKRAGCQFVRRSTMASSAA